MANGKQKTDHIALPLGQREYPGNQLNNVSITDKLVAWRLAPVPRIPTIKQHPFVIGRVFNYPHTPFPSDCTWLLHVVLYNVPQD